MIFGHINHSQSYRALLAQPAWKIAFDTSLKLMINHHSDFGAKWPKQILNIHEYETQPRNKCRFEHHHR